jgi:ppGpp synthetase/RelA/SpoT-type nucleotidyltranferase
VYNSTLVPAAFLQGFRPASDAVVRRSQSVSSARRASSVRVLERLGVGAAVQRQTLARQGTMDEVEYRDILRAPERALQQMLLDFRFFQEDVPGFLVFSIESRLKTYQSAKLKAQQRGVNISDLSDLAGARIIVGTTQEVDVVSRFFTRKEFSEELLVESDEAISRPDGYRSRHLVLRYPPSYVRSAFPARVEVQLPTIFQHAFNNLSRSWTYKSNHAFSPTWKDSFSAISAQLDALNASASELYSQVVESARGQDPCAPLTPFSLQVIVRSAFNEVVPLDDAVDSVDFLADWAHVTTNGEFRSFLDDERLRILWEQLGAHRRSGNQKFVDLPQSRWSFQMVYFRFPEAAQAALDAADDDLVGRG